MSTQCNIHVQINATKYCYECESRLCNKCYIMHKHPMVVGIDQYFYSLRLLIEGLSYDRILKEVDTTKSKIVNEFNAIITRIKSKQRQLYSSALSPIELIGVTECKSKLESISKNANSYIIEESDIGKVCESLIEPIKKIISSTVESIKEYKSK